MADSYIDNTEVIIYTDYSTARILNKLVGAVPELDSALVFITNTLNAHKDAVSAAKYQSQQSTASHFVGASLRKEALSDGMNALRRFRAHLKSHAPNTIDLRQFFPPTGTLESVNRKPSSVAAALNRIHGLLSDPACTVEHADTWKTRIQAAYSALAGPIAQAQGALDDKGDTTPELEQARVQWNKTYLNAKRLVEVVLRQAGKPIELERYFYDLRVPSGAKVVAPPVDEPDDAPLAETGEAKDKPVP